MNMETQKNLGDQPDIASDIGRKVIVGLLYQAGAAGEWLPAPEYDEWRGEIVRLPKQSAVNGNVYVMPEDPLGTEYPTRHLRVCDRSPRQIQLGNGTEVVIRHFLRSVLPEAE